MKRRKSEVLAFMCMNKSLMTCTTQDALDSVWIPVRNTHLPCSAWILRSASNVLRLPAWSAILCNRGGGGGIVPVVPVVVVALAIVGFVGC